MTLTQSEKIDRDIFGGIEDLYTLLRLARHHGPGAGARCKGSRELLYLYLKEVQCVPHPAGERAISLTVREPTILASWHRLRVRCNHQDKLLQLDMGAPVWGKARGKS